MNEKEIEVSKDRMKTNHYYTHYDQVRSILLNCTWVILIGKDFNEENNSKIEENQITKKKYVCTAFLAHCGARVQASAPSTLLPN